MCSIRNISFLHTCNKLLRRNSGIVIFPDQFVLTV